MCSRPVGRMPLKTLLFFPSATISNSRLLVFVAFLPILHLCIKSFFEALFELEPFDRLFARGRNRSSVKHCYHGPAPVRSGGHPAPHIAPPCAAIEFKPLHK